MFPMQAVAVWFLSAQDRPTGLDRIVANAAKVKGNGAAPWFDRFPLAMLRFDRFEHRSIQIESRFLPPYLLFNRFDGYD
jgi:hypothetical protein